MEGQRITGKGISSSLLFGSGILLLVMVMLLGISLGAVGINLSGTMQALGRGPAGGSAGDPMVHTIVWKLRLPRVLLAALTGSCLGAAGAAFQGLFRNSLADPYVIGASSGAALGASLAIISGVSFGFAGLSAVPAAAFGGSILAVALVYSVSGAAVTGKPAINLLLAGTALSSMISAFVSFLVVTNDDKLHSVYFWLLGGFSGRSWSDLTGVLPFMVLGTGVLLFSVRALDVLAFGEESARSMGLHVGRTRLFITGAASLCVAAAVAAGGTIGFVGLVSPHLARLVFGSEHRVVMPGSLLMGALVLVAADLVARTAAAPLEIPVGIFTAFLGGPFFLYLLKKRGGALGKGMS